MKRRQSGEMLRGLQQWRSGHKLGFVYDEASTEKALEIAFRIIEGDPSAWSELDLRPDLLTNVIANLRSEGESALADRVEKVRFDFNESRYIKTQEKSMRIRGSELRKIIKEELRRSMLNEAEILSGVYKGSLPAGFKSGVEVKGIVSVEPSGDIFDFKTDLGVVIDIEGRAKSPTGSYNATLSIDDKNDTYELAIGSKA